MPLRPSSCVAQKRALARLGVVLTTTASGHGAHKLVTFRQTSLASLDPVRIRFPLITLGLLAAGALAAAGLAPVADAAPMCATTAEQGAQSAPSPGKPCWTDVSQVNGAYPFGNSGSQIDLDTPTCEQAPNPCEPLEVTSMAFRAWNRGLAATALTEDGGGTAASTDKQHSALDTYGVWIYNGVRWYPNPTFPGGSVCKGDTILWAGKLDYWLVGENENTNASSGEDWPKLCRFDGANDEWEALPVPAATLAEVPQQQIDGALSPRPGGINAGACFAWNDCWFFGTYGVVVHWDGQTLSSVSTGLGSSPWLQADYTAAIARTDEAGNPFAVAVTASTTGNSVVGDQTGSKTHTGQQSVQPEPDGSAPPQLFASSQGGFLATSFTSVSNPGSATDLVAVDFDSAGEGWVAGDPEGDWAANSNPAFPATAPVTRISTGGGALACQGTPPSEFSNSSYLWSSIGVFPGGDALAGGIAQVAGSSEYEPVLVHVSCGSAPTVTRFRVEDPEAVDPASAPLVPANENGYVTSVAVNAVNDAWAATTGDTISNINGNVYQVPHLYHLTDTQPPLAPAGNDHESRPITQTADAVQYLVSPPVVIATPPKPTVVTKAGAKRHRTVHLPSPIYAITYAAPQRATNGTVTLTINFKVRAAVTIGIDALRDGRVVSSTGLRHFRPHTTGQLVLTLDPANWPTKITFVMPKQKSKA